MKTASSLSWVARRGRSAAAGLRNRDPAAGRLSTARALLDWPGPAVPALTGLVLAERASEVAAVMWAAALIGAVASSDRGSAANAAALSSGVALLPLLLLLALRFLTLEGAQLLSVQVALRAGTDFDGQICAAALRRYAIGEHPPDNAETTRDGSAAIIFSQTASHTVALLSHAVATPMYLLAALQVSPAAVIWMGCVGMVRVIVTARLPKPRSATAIIDERMHHAFEDAAATVAQAGLTVSIAGTEAALIERLKGWLDAAAAKAGRLVRIATGERALCSAIDALALGACLIVCVTVAGLSYAAGALMLLLMLVVQRSWRELDRLLRLEPKDLPSRAPPSEPWPTQIRPSRSGGGGADLLRGRRKLQVRLNAGRGQGSAPARASKIEMPVMAITAVLSTTEESRQLVRVLLGHGNPDNPAVAIDGEPLEPASISAWRRHLALAPSSPPVIHATLAENLRLTCPFATADDLARVIRAADLTSLLRRCRLGLATVIGPRGVDLTAAEAHRLGLARALLQRPELLLVEDLPREHGADQDALRALLSALRGRCTVILVTSNPHSTRMSDWVVVLKGGRSAEAGTFADLAVRPGSRLAAMIAADPL